MAKRTRKPKGYVKRTFEQREADILFCSDLFLKGYTYRAIAVMLNDEIKRRSGQYTITPQMVCYDMKYALEQWRSERLDNLDDYITRELQKLDKIEIELWAAWEASKEGNRRVVSNGDSVSNMYETTTGNYKYLDLLLNVQQRRAKLLGIDAPLKIESDSTSSAMMILPNGETIEL